MIQLGEQLEFECHDPQMPEGWMTNMTLERLDDWTLEITVSDQLYSVTIVLTNEQESQLKRELTGR